MKRVLAAAAAAAAVGAGVAVQWLRSRTAASRAERNRWLTVTVNCPPDRLAEPPAPLVALADHIEIRTTPAPGGKGTELAARLRETVPAGTLKRVTGHDPRQDVRQALREAKSLIETGEVMQPDTPPTTRPTPGGKLLELATRRAGGEGRL